MVVNGYCYYCNNIGHHLSLILMANVFNHCRWRYLQYWCQLATGLLGGAYTKTPIDLVQVGAFETKAFNFKTMIISIPQLGLTSILILVRST
jgi:hypothetical protein